MKGAIDLVKPICFIEYVVWYRGFAGSVPSPLIILRINSILYCRIQVHRPQIVNVERFRVGS